MDHDFAMMDGDEDEVEGGLSEDELAKGFGDDADDDLDGADLGA